MLISSIHPKPAGRNMMNPSAVDEIHSVPAVMRIRNQIMRIGRISVVLISALAMLATVWFYLWHQNATPSLTGIKNVMPPTIMVNPVPVQPTVAAPQPPPLIFPLHQVKKKKLRGVLRPPAKIVETEPIEKLPKSDTSKPPLSVEQKQNNITIDPILQLAWEAYHHNDFESSFTHYSEVLHLNAVNRQSPNRDALLGLAAVAQQRSQDGLAVQYYNQLLAVDPLDADAQAGITSLLGENSLAGTESRLKNMLEQHPEAASLHFALGNLYAEQARWSEAQQAYFSACSAQPNNAPFAFNLAVSLDHLGQGKLAAQYYRRALQLDNTSIPHFDHPQTQLHADELTTHQTIRHER
jgi:Flp pilus assembly protein TadD